MDHSRELLQIHFTPQIQLVVRASGVPNGAWRTPVVFHSEVIKPPQSVNREVVMHNGWLGRSDVILVTTRNRMVLGQFGVNTTPQMTRFRGVKVCSKWLQERIDDHSIQSDYKCTNGLEVQK